NGDSTLFGVSVSVTIIMVTMHLRAEKEDLRSLWGNIQTRCSEFRRGARCKVDPEQDESREEVDRRLDVSLVK
ncbi:unnamed protein product, partial [Polarella glacialis]